MTDMGILHDRLHGRLWHTTHPERFRAVLDSGCLSVNPSIPNSERWKASRPGDYPFVRTLGGVSLFDFNGFNPAKYGQSHPMSNWYTFVPYIKSWGGAVWIEINREALSGSLISADDLVTKWNQDGNRGHTIMPRIESAHIGDLPVSAFRSTFMTWADGNKVCEFEVVKSDQADFDRILTEWRGRKDTQLP